MNLSRKAINFDLSTNKLKKYFSDTREAYGSIKNFMLKNGFEHRQYSGYTSIKPMSDKQINLLIKRLTKKCAWIGSCIKEFDVTDIGEQYSLKDTIQSLCTQELNKKINHNKNLQIQSNQKSQDIEL
ncbi:VapD family protein [Campylobacter helveticus]|uniref:Vapd n=1 Tax=Campylobacter helveticus TaxID=28898 RepID=A0AAX2UIN1_9BACT|nr:VapD family protein [Campylobacter helveticus]EAJ0412376.1 vapd [Campylobacter upsaliensis]EEY3085987.1 vapd [Campylobacter jejuni]EAJ0879426.1 vapd [Campylobacter upsaliensis]EAJ7097840.1 vapd [Campylobacter upsaliensis]EAK0465260.1 vapd [Campylobacter upsaliensis]